MISTAHEFRRVVAVELGNVPDEIEPGRIQRFSLKKPASDKLGWCLYKGRVGFYGDHRQGITLMWTARDDRALTLAQRQQRSDDMQRARVDAAAAQARRCKDAAVKNAALLATTLPLTDGDPVTRYLASRYLALDTWPAALRCHPHLAYWSLGKLIGYFPAMVGAVTDVAGQLVSLHRTYLTADGKKADVEIVKKLTAASAPLAGCSIKLAFPGDCGGVWTLAVAEGIETALACIRASAMPTVSAVSASGLARYCWPEGVQSLIVFADNDASQVGQRAGAALADRANSSGLCARLLTPPDPGLDWADVWAAQMGVQ